MSQRFPSRGKVLKVYHPLDRNFEAAPEPVRSTRIATLGTLPGGINASSSGRAPTWSCGSGVNRELDGGAFLEIGAGAVQPRLWRRPADESHSRPEAKRK